MTGIKITSVDAVTAEENVINDCVEQQALIYSSCGSFRSFNNQTAGAVLMHGYETTTARRRMELQDLIEDAWLGF